MLSEAEEKVMHLARGGGGGGTENFLYEEEDPTALAESMALTQDHIASGHEAEPQGSSSYFSPDLLLNHRDPMMDGELIRSRNTLGFPYSPHDPVIGSYGTHDPTHPEPHLQRPLPSIVQIDHTSDSLRPPQRSPTPPAETINGTMLPPVYRPSRYETMYDFSSMEEFAAEERQKIGVPLHLSWANGHGISAELRRRLAQSNTPKEESVSKTDSNPQAPTASELLGSISQTLDEGETPQTVSSPPTMPGSAFGQRRQRKLSHSNPTPHPRRQAKLAMFEGGLGPLPPATATGNSTGVSSDARPHLGHRSATNDSGIDRPYRFSFYSNAATATIHARSISELPAEGQSFEDLFMGRHGGLHTHEPTVQPITATGLMANGGSGPSTAPQTTQTTPRAGTPAGADAPTGAAKQAREAIPHRVTTRSNIFPNHPGNGPATAADDDYEKRTWWLDIMSPTDEEMKMLSRVSWHFLSRLYFWFDICFVKRCSLSIH